MFGPVPPFSLTGSRYDMTTFTGRTMYYYNSINPLMCLETERTILAQRMLLDAYKTSLSDGGGSGSSAVSAGAKAPRFSDKELWRARDVVESCVHPTTDEVLFPLCRMSAFVPVNALIIPFMMSPATILSPARTIFIQWFNQSYNCVINYANRSSDAFPLTELFQAYLCAVTISVGGALGATKLLKKVGTQPSVAATLVRGVLPFTAVSLAGIANLALMRRGEWNLRGIAVKDEDGVVRGTSLAAGQDSLRKCSVTRVLWNIPSMVLPTLLMYPLCTRFAVVRRQPRVVEMGLQVLGLSLGVPPALAVYPTTVSIDVTRLEPEFHHLTDAMGRPLTTLTYYKGL